MPRERSRYDLRCFCKGEPLLAVYGRDEKGALYVHIRTYRKHEIYSDIFVTQGSVNIWCRYCNRWHRVIIRQAGEAALEEVDTPAEIAVNG